MKTYNAKLKTNKNNSFMAVVVGFTLVVLVTFIFWLRSSSPQEDNNSNIQNDQPEIKKGIPISAAVLLKKISAKEKITILDMRSKDLFVAEHILDSKNISTSNFEKLFESADKKNTYVIIDSSGSESAQLAYKFSKDFEISNIYYLENGLDFWKNQLNPTIKQGDPNSFSDQAKIGYISSEMLKKLVEEENNQIKVVDIRKQLLFKDGHIKNSINIFSEELETKREELPVSKRIIVVDEDGIGAFKSAVSLFDMGFFNILVLSDGLNGWKQKGFELVK